MSTTPTDIRTAAMRWLVRREYSAHELTTRLHHRGFDPDVVAIVVNELIEEDLLCDKRFSDALVHSRLGRGYGPVKIAGQLRERGVSPTVIDAALDATDPCWLDAGRTAWQRRFPDAANDYNEWARQARFLVQRGFTTDQARKIIGDFGQD